MDYKWSAERKTTEKNNEGTEEQGTADKEETRRIWKVL